MRSVYIDSIEYELGRQARVSDISAVSDDEELCGYFAATGLEFFRKSSETSIDLAMKSISKTLEKWILGERSIDAIVYCTTDFWSRQSYTLDFSNMCARLGLSEVPTFGCTLAECGNIAYGLQIADAFVRGGRFNNVLVATADVCPLDHKRIVKPNVSVMSDGASSCVVTCHPTDLKVVDIECVNNHAVRLIDNQKDFLKTLRGTARSISTVASRLYARNAIGGANVGRLISNNQNLSVTRTFAAQMDLHEDQVDVANLASNAHVFSSDVLINLKDYRSQGQKPDELIMTLSNGLCGWGGAILQAKAN